MNTAFQKILVLFIAFIFGISQETAAQYGIVSCTYKFKGNVQEGVCGTGISGIKVSLTVPSDSNIQPLEVFTDEQGNYLLEYSTTSFPNNAKAVRIWVEDVDGAKNRGTFLPQQVLLPISSDNVWESERGDWERYFVYLTEQRFLMRTEQELPCGSKDK